MQLPDSGAFLPTGNLPIVLCVHVTPAVNEILPRSFLHAELDERGHGVHVDDTTNQPTEKADDQ
jgi:hypothetical protein